MRCLHRYRQGSHRFHLVWCKDAWLSTPLALPGVPNFFNLRDKPLRKSSSPQTRVLVFKQGASHGRRTVVRSLSDYQEESKKRPVCKHVQFSDGRILQVYFWAVIHDRPTTWACRARNWPARRRNRDLPCDATMSLRLSPQLISASAHGGDIADAWTCLSLGRIGAETGFQATGGADATARIVMPTGAGPPKLRHGDTRCSVLGARVGCPRPGNAGAMNASDAQTAVKLVPQLTQVAYVLGDSSHDSNPLHGVCDQHGCQLVAPRRKNPRPTWAMSGINRGGYAASRCWNGPCYWEPPPRLLPVNSMRWAN